jgi:DNA-binding beta-propeller fold protein YncE
MKPCRKRTPLIAGAVLVVSLATAAVAFAGDGTLSPRDCIVDNDSLAAGCGQATDGLQGPLDIALSPDGRSAYVAALSDSAVVRFKRARASGVLTPKGCIDDKQLGPDTCAKSAEGLGGAEQLTVSPDGRSVYVTGSDGAIAIFSRNRKTGRLRSRGCVGDAQTGPAGCAKHAPALEGARTPVVSPDGHFVYVAASNDEAVSIFARKHKTGKLRSLGCIDDNDGGPANCAHSTNGLDEAYDLALSPDGKYLYAGSESGDSAIVIFKRKAKSGMLRSRGCIDDTTSGGDTCAHSADGLNGLQGIAVSPDGHSLYTASGFDNAVGVFSRSKTTGALTPKGCIDDFGNGPDPCPSSAVGLDAANDVVVSPNGKAVYVASGGPDNAVLAFSRNRSTGNLSPGDCVNDSDTSGIICALSSDGLEAAAGLAVSPDSASIYAVGESDDAVVRLHR